MQCAIALTAELTFYRVRKQGRLYELSHRMQAFYDLFMDSGAPGGGVQTPPRNSEVLTKSNRIIN